MTPLLKVEGIHTYYGKSHILHGVSLEIGRGEVVGFHICSNNGADSGGEADSMAGCAGGQEGGKYQVVQVHGR